MSISIANSAAASTAQIMTASTTGPTAGAAAAPQMNTQAVSIDDASSIINGAQGDSISQSVTQNQSMQDKRLQDQLENQMQGRVDTPQQAPNTVSASGLPAPGPGYSY